MNNQLRGIPDSMDLVSLWGGAFNLTEAQKSDLKEVRERKEPGYCIASISWILVEV